MKTFVNIYPRSIKSVLTWGNTVRFVFNSSADELTEITESLLCISEAYIFNFNFKFTYCLFNYLGIFVHVLSESNIFVVSIKTEIGFAKNVANPWSSVFRARRRAFCESGTTNI